MQTIGISAETTALRAGARAPLPALEFFHGAYPVLAFDFYSPKILT
jgi:hypothetical protein